MEDRGVAVPLKVVALIDIPKGICFAISPLLHYFTMSSKNCGAISTERGCVNKITNYPFKRFLHLKGISIYLRTLHSKCDRSGQVLAP